MSYPSNQQEVLLGNDSDSGVEYFNERLTQEFHRDQTIIRQQQRNLEQKRIIIDLLNKRYDLLIKKLIIIIFLFILSVIILGFLYYNEYTFSRSLLKDQAHVYAAKELFNKNIDMIVEFLLKHKL